VPITQYVALLRGINVGGKNPIGMAALKAAFEKDGFENVATYIQSGNVLFETPRPARELTDAVETMVEKRFGTRLVVVVRSHKQLKDVVTNAPPGYGSQPDEYRYDVLFLRAPATAKSAVNGFPLKEGVDSVWAGNGVLYTSRLTSRATSSRISRIIDLPFYKHTTIRNWNTTTKLLSLLDDRRRSTRD
jgi:uncharacterized protein (DUF1697 family)